MAFEVGVEDWLGSLNVSKAKRENYVKSRRSSEAYFELGAGSGKKSSNFETPSQLEKVWGSPNFPLGFGDGPI